MIVTDDEEYSIFESSVLLLGGNDILDYRRKKHTVLLRGGIARVMLAPVFYVPAKNGQKILPKSSLC